MNPLRWFVAVVAVAGLAWNASDAGWRIVVSSACLALALGAVGAAWVVQRATQKMNQR